MVLGLLYTCSAESLTSAYDLMLVNERMSRLRLLQTSDPVFRHIYPSPQEWGMSSRSYRIEHGAWTRVSVTYKDISLRALVSMRERICRVIRAGVVWVNPSISVSACFLPEMQGRIAISILGRQRHRLPQGNNKQCKVSDDCGCLQRCAFEPPDLLPRPSSGLFTLSLEVSTLCHE